MRFVDIVGLHRYYPVQSPLLLREAIMRIFVAIAQELDRRLPELPSADMENK